MPSCAFDAVRPNLPVEPHLAPQLRMPGAMKTSALPLGLLLAACSASHDTPDSGTVPACGECHDATLLGDAGFDATALFDSGPMDASIETFGFVECGAVSCEVPGQACRATCQSGGEPAPVCVDAPMGWETGECPDEESFPILVATCDGPEDCGEEACIVLFGGAGNYPRCDCLPAADGGCVPRLSVALCHSLADCPSWATGCEPNPELHAGFYRTCVE